MSFTLKHETEERKIKVESEQEIPLSSPWRGALETVLTELEPLIPEKVTYNAGAYEIKLMDARRWNQEILFEFGGGATDPAMTFDVPDAWRVSEFRRQRAMRDWIIEMVNAFGLTEFKCTWEPSA